GVGRVAPRLWAIAPAYSRADRTGRRGAFARRVAPLLPERRRGEVEEVVGPAGDAQEGEEERRGGREPVREADECDRAAGEAERPVVGGPAAVLEGGEALGREV